MPTLATLARTTLRPLSAALLCAAVWSGAQAREEGALLPAGTSPAQLLPVWNARSGRVEALLLLDRRQEQPGTLDWLLADEKTPGLGLSLRSTRPSGSRIGGSLRLDNNSGLALLCNQGIHMAMSLGQGQHCLLAQVAGTPDPLQSSTSSAQRLGATLSAGWQSPGGLLDLSFGLSWLHAPVQGTAASLASAGMMLNPNLPRLLPPTLGDMHMQGLSLSSAINLPGQRWLSLDTHFGSQKLVTLTGGPVHWDSATITLGVGMRGLSGRLTGRLLELPEGSNWSGLDLDFSWRTPWQGELSFGAENLLDNKAPDTRDWPLRELPGLEAPSGRVPYVRYKQDL